MKKLGFIVLLIVAFQACNKQTIKKDKLYINNDIEIELIDVEDSRCPAEIKYCFNGNVNVSIKVKNKSTNEIDIVSITNSFGHSSNEAIVFGYEIELSVVNPYPKMGESIELDDYKLKLLVVKQ